MGGAEHASAAIDAALAAGDVSEAAFAGFERTMRTAVELFLGAVQSFYRGELRQLLFARDQRAILIVRERLIAPARKEHPDLDQSITEGRGVTRAFQEQVGAVLVGVGP